MRNGEFHSPQSFCRRRLSISGLLVSCFLHCITSAVITYCYHQHHCCHHIHYSELWPLCYVSNINDQQPRDSCKCHCTVGQHRFAVNGPTIWTSLPVAQWTSDRSISRLSTLTQQERQMACKKSSSSIPGLDLWQL